jgi:hypothetical protein
MGQEFFIKSDNLESKVRQLLPSQGGLGAGFDLTGSTTVVPIIDLTESASGAQVRADLQTSFSLDNINAFNVTAGSVTLANSPGYWRIQGFMTITAASGTNQNGRIDFTDGVSTKKFFEMGNVTFSTGIAQIERFDYTIFLKAGDSVTTTSSSALVRIAGSVRQIADIDGNLIDPT